MQPSLNKTLKKAYSFTIRYLKGCFDKKRFLASPIPKLSIETTNICDSKCVFCANRFMRRQRQILEMPLFKKAVDEFARMGGKTINFNTVIGDPLADPNLLERARYARQYRQFESLGFVTTLQGLHRFDIDEFFDSGIDWLGISCVLSGRKRYSEFFGVDKYDIFLDNLYRLIRENDKRKKINISLSVVPTNEPASDIVNHPDFKRINSLLKQDLILQVKNRSLHVDDWLGTVNLPAYLKKRPLYPRAFRPCGLLYTAVMIYSNGRIGACSCKDFEAEGELVLGDLKEITIKEAWCGNKLSCLRSNWRKANRIPHICKKCRHYLW